MTDSPLTEDELAEIERRRDAIQAGDWAVMWRTINGQAFPTTVHAYDIDADDDGLARDYGADVCKIADTDKDEANATFIATAPLDIDRLIASHRALEKKADSFAHALAAAQNELFAARSIFHEYAALHRAKSPPDEEKASRNADHAARITKTLMVLGRAALSHLKQGGEG